MKMTEATNVGTNTLPQDEETKVLMEQESIYTQNSDASVVNDSKEVSMFMDFIKQLRPGIDLFRIAVPPATLEPKSLLERLSLYSQPHSVILSVADMKNAEQRFLTVLRFFLACLRTTPRKSIMGAKPYNPILGEEFHCSWKHKDSTTTFIAEQVSHHPPISCFYMENRKKNIVFEGTIKPRTKFNGNSISSIMDGTLIFHILNYGEKYEIVFPHVVARGILWGSQYLEVNKTLEVTCAKTGYSAIVEFKSKKDNLLEGKVKKGDEVIYTLEGNVVSRINLIDVAKKREICFLDVKDIQSVEQIVKPVAQQAPNESRRVWHKLTYGLVTKNYEAATKAKTQVEEAQRVLAKQQAEQGIQWKTKYFVQTAGDHWQYKNFNDKPYSPDEDKKEDSN